MADSLPDFLVRIRDGQAEPLNLIIEVTGEQKKDKAAKTSTARTLWVPAVNNHGGLGRRAFLEINDPWDAKNTIRRFLPGGIKNGPDIMDGEQSSIQGGDFMAADDLLVSGRIRKTPDVIGGDACIRKTRIAVWMLVDSRKLGMTDEEIRNRYDPPLSQADLEAAWEYYQHNREEIERAIQENEEA